MKKILAFPLNNCRVNLFIILFIFGTALFSPSLAQTQATASKHDTAKAPAPVFRKAYLGLGGGLDNYCGFIGVGAIVKIIKPLYIRVGAGIGSWGDKVSATLLYKEKESSGWAIGVGYSYASGLNNFSLSAQTLDSIGTYVTKNVKMNLLPATTLNLTAAYDWYYHNKNFFYLEFGYSLPLQTLTPYQVTDGSVLSSTSQAAIKIDAPGGFVLGVGIMFGL